MKESKLFKSLAATFVVIVLSGPAVVQGDAISYIEVGTARVSYADLNLESEEGVRVLYRRLKRASKELCSATPPQVAGSLPNVYSLDNTQETRKCYREALSNAVDKIDNEDLTRIHAE